MRFRLALLGTLAATPALAQTPPAGSGTFLGGTVAGATSFLNGAAVVGGLSIDNLTGSVSGATITAPNGTSLPGLTRTAAAERTDMPQLLDYVIPGSADITQQMLQFDTNLGANGVGYIGPGLLNIPALSGVGTVTIQLPLPSSPTNSGERLLNASGNGFYGAATQPFNCFLYDTVATFFNDTYSWNRCHTFHGQNPVLTLNETFDTPTGTATGGNPIGWKVLQTLGTNANSAQGISQVLLQSFNDSPSGILVDQELNAVGTGSPTAIQVTVNRYAGSTVSGYPMNLVVNDYVGNSNQAKGITPLEADIRAKGLDNGGASSPASYGGYGTATGYRGVPSGTGVRNGFNVVEKQSVNAANPLDMVNAGEFRSAYEATWSNSGSTASNPSVLSKYGFLCQLPIEISCFDASWSAKITPTAAAFSMAAEWTLLMDGNLNAVHTFGYSATAGADQLFVQDASGNPLLGFSVADGTGQMNLAGPIGVNGNAYSFTITAQGDYAVSGGAAITAPTVTVPAAPGGGTTALLYSTLGIITTNSCTISGGDGYFVGQVTTPVGGSWLTRASLTITAITADSPQQTDDAGNILGVPTACTWNTPGRYTVTPAQPMALNGGNGGASATATDFKVTSVYSTNNGGSGYVTPSAALTFGSGTAAGTAQFASSLQIVSPVYSPTPPSGDVSMLVSNDAWVSANFVGKTTAQTTPPAATVTGGGSATVTGTDTGMEVTVTGAASTIAIAFNLGHGARPKTCTGNATNGASAAAVGIRSITASGFAAQATIAAGGVLELACQF